MATILKKLIIILFLVVCSCKTGFDSSSKKCIEKEERQILIEAVDLFEFKIQKQYPEISKEAAYFEFLTNWADNKLPMEFFQDTLSLKVRNMDIWEESKRSEKNMDRERKIFNVDSMNPVRVKLNSEFSTCLSKTTKDWDGIRRFLLANSKYRLSPRFALNDYFYRSNENDLKDFENRLSIVLGAYYQTMFNIKNTVANKELS
ncbi:hypothetical protein [Flagellimonas crocea]|uniref:hypothetical protein n=1 Tax=Flagellimonas crocea TaxID=3067311 RepID=UPI00296FDA53|nr:hypothetical protein [Muricauda sp. DH64]